jgi:hypothetical protein
MTPNHRTLVTAAVALFVICTLFAPCRTVVAASPADEDDFRSWVDQRVDAWQPTKAERLFDEIGWVTDIRRAEQLAQRHGRPIFLFTHDGRMAVGRC